MNSKSSSARSYSNRNESRNVGKMEPPPGKPLLLYVEDSSDDVDLMRFAAARSGINLRTCPDMPTARKYLLGIGIFANREAFPYPDAMLLDFHVAYETAIDMLSWFSSAAVSPLPVFVCSDAAWPEEFSRCYAKGAVVCVTKPSSLEELQVLVDTIASSLRGHPPTFQEVRSLPCYEPPRRLMVDNEVNRRTK